jgi:hypothetical protein
MPRHLLSARQVQTARRDLPDGDGLILRVKPNGASWTLRYTSPSGRRREFGLGRVVRDSLEAAGASLRRAQQRAEEARALLDSGLDPIGEKHAKRAKVREAETQRRADANRERTTLARVARVSRARRRAQAHADSRRQRQGSSTNSVCSANMD